jgi:TolB protein
LTAGPGQDVQLAISPKGNRLAFAILKQNADIWRLPVDAGTGEPTGEPSSLIATSREDSRGAWSPDGQWIAFNSDRTGDMNIWVHSLKDGSSRQVTKGPGGDYQPNWSPDGKFLTFFSSRHGSPGIWRVDCESTEMHKLTTNESIHINPFYSPDGKFIAYLSDESGRPEVWVMEPDGRSVRQLTHIGARGHFLRWSPDSRYIMFFCTNLKPGLYRVSLDAGEPERVCLVEGGAHISFNPDQYLVMDVLAHKSLWTFPVNKPELGPRKVFEFSDPSFRIDYPLWSPDGNWILFDLFRPQGGDIWTMENFE